MLTLIPILPSVSNLPHTCLLDEGNNSGLSSPLICNFFKLFLSLGTNMYPSVTLTDALKVV